MVWNAVNNSLTSIRFKEGNKDKKYSYNYLSDGQRLSKTVDGKTTIYIYNLSIIGIEGGTVLSEANNCAICYDANGTKMWESDTKQYGHILDMLYSQEMKEIYCISWNPLDAEFRHFICLNSNDGTVKNVID